MEHAPVPIQRLSVVVDDMSDVVRLKLQCGIEHLEGIAFISFSVANQSPEVAVRGYVVTVLRTRYWCRTAMATVFEAPRPTDPMGMLSRPGPRGLGYEGMPLMDRSLGRNLLGLAQERCDEIHHDLAVCGGEGSYFRQELIVEPGQSHFRESAP